IFQTFSRALLSFSLKRQANRFPVQMSPRRFWIVLAVLFFLSNWQLLQALEDGVTSTGQCLPFTIIPSPPLHLQLTRLSSPSPTVKLASSQVFTLLSLHVRRPSVARQLLLQWLPIPLQSLQLAGVEQ